ncbi:Chemotaxis protein histidine kinase-like protein (fragment) [Hyella patelloides LEGE 07179]|uniref:Chemotaxis protein histidine kinase-like protein n=1 Tax=Hyella patelloides LEGE 07179 TaxID=945734 RepID=A0A563VVL4_9CYAN
MDTEQQIRLNFLDEAEEYFDLMESNLIGLADAVVDSQKVDLILRSAHSIKGGAAMMGFDTLSGIAHCLEDFFKILRVRYSSSQITTEVETLLLQGVDLLRDVSKLNQKGVKVTKSELNERTQPIFPKLHQKLGDLEDADENALLAQDEEVDPAVLIFEEGVDAVLDRFETKSKELEIAELSQELTKTAQELIGFGKMASLEPFIQLCQSIQKEARSLSPSEIAPLAEQALKAWRRSHALVLRGRIEKLPSCLEGREKLASETENRHNNIDFPENNFLDLSDLPFTPTEEAIEADFELVEQDFAEASQLQSAFEIDADAIDSPEAIEADFELVEQDFAEASQLQSAFEIDATVIDSPEAIEADFELVEQDFAEASQLQSAFEIDADAIDSPEAIEADFELVEQDFAEASQLQSAFEIDATVTESPEEPKSQTNFAPLEHNFIFLELNGLQSTFEIDRFT